MKRDPRSYRPQQLHRPPAPRKKAAAPPPAPGPDRPEGFYLQPVRRASAMHPYGWPPRWEPQIGALEVKNADGETQREVATRNRERGLAEGRAYATGTVPMLGTPKNYGPKGWMR